MTEQATCPDCGAGVVVTPAGRLLESMPHRDGLWLPAGGLLTFVDRSQAPRGHRLHKCDDAGQGHLL